MKDQKLSSGGKSQVRVGLNFYRHDRVPQKGLQNTYLDHNLCLSLHKGSIDKLN